MSLPRSKATLVPGVLGLGHAAYLRIAFVIGTLEIGGAELQVSRLAVELSARGHQVHVFSQSGGGPLQKLLEDGGVPYSIYSFTPGARRHAERFANVRPVAITITLATMASDFRPMLALWRDLRRWKPDVCHAFLPQACLWGMIGSRIVGVPVRVAGRRALSFPEPPAKKLSARMWRGFGRLSKRWTTVVLANSVAVARSVHEVDAVPMERIRVIPNGVALPAGIDESEADPGRTPPVGLMVANLIAYKGHADLIEALSGMVDPPVIRLVGDGPERATLEASARRAGLDGKLMFEGTVPGAGRLFGQAQFAVLASHQEGMPNAVLEAMSHGVPVVATSVGGIPELIDHDVNGLLVPPHDPVALREALIRITDDAGLRVRLGRAARARASEFGWDRCVQAHLELYTELLARGRRDRPR